MPSDSNARFVYRLGNKSDGGLTPRQKDTVAGPGAKPGLSVSVTQPPAGVKAMELDLTRLDGTGLAFFPDDVASGGHEGHGVIAPINAAGGVDTALLQEWADSRPRVPPHRFTEAVKDAARKLGRKQ